MRVIYTADALNDLDEILAFIRANYPAIYVAFEQRLRLVERRIGTWPESAPRVDERLEIRVVALVRYPYRLFYRVTADAVEVLHLHHAAREGPWRAED
jgi:plasmid stabilization system protein ParE